MKGVTITLQELEEAMKALPDNTYSETDVGGGMMEVCSNGFCAIVPIKQYKDQFKKMFNDESNQSRSDVDS